MLFEKQIFVMALGEPINHTDDCILCGSCGTATDIYLFKRFSGYLGILETKSLLVFLSTIL